MKMTVRITIVGALVVFFAVVTAVVFIPSLVWDPPQTVIAHAYSDLEAQGRKVFYSNGCNYCHTQYVREADTAMGPVSEGGNFVFDNPMILGSERTGPDLSYIGRKRSEGWEIDHLKDPRELSPMSLMANYKFLSDEEMEAVAAYLFELGDRVAAERMIRPPDAYVHKVDPISYEMVSLAGDEPKGWPTFEAAGLKEGKELYVQHCLTCHGCAGNGLGTYAGTLTVAPADLKREPFRSMPEDQFFWHVSEGVQGSVMPPWKESLTEDERWKVVRYVRLIYSQPVMHDPDEGDPVGEYADLTNPLPNSVEVLDEGKQIWIRECMVCHGDEGRGHGPYREILEPGPPDFGDGTYGDATDADYFWRISEGVPWTAMPTWKLVYQEEDRWKLVHYIRTFFTQTEDRPPGIQEGDEPKPNVDFQFPEFFQTSMRFPEDVSFERGKVVFLVNCAHCHGLAGDGEGWDGQYLNPKPADLRKKAGKELTPETQGEHMARVTFGIKDTAMPYWGEFLPWEDRWDDVKYVLEAWMVGRPVTSSVYGSGEVPGNYATIGSQMYLDEGHTISVTHGADLYSQLCVTCHGDTGKGDGPGNVGSASGGPASFSTDMAEQYIYWRIWEGVPESTMPPFKWFLSGNDVWDITVYFEQSIGGRGGY